MDNLAPVLMDLLAAKQLRLGQGAPLPDSSKGLRRKDWRQNCWSRDSIGGCLAELADGAAAASLTAAMELVRDAQQSGETAVWVTSTASCFFAPDAAEGGVDLAALTVVRVPGEGVLRAADKLARSGAFGLIIIDVTPIPGASQLIPIPTGAQARLLGLAQSHDIAIVFLTGRRSAQSRLGSLVSLRGEMHRTRLGKDRYEVEVRAIKDKRRAPGWTHAQECRGPIGLR